VIVGQAALGFRARRCAGFSRREALGGPAIMLAVAALVTLPLMLYLLSNPEDANARTSAVSVFASDDGRANPTTVLVENLGRNLGMFIWRGDETLRHNLPGRPVFDWLLAPFFILGVVLSLWQVR